MLDFKFLFAMFVTLSVYFFKPSNAALPYLLGTVIKKPEKTGSKVTFIEKKAVISRKKNKEFVFPNLNKISDHHKPKLPPIVKLSAEKQLYIDGERKLINNLIALKDLAPSFLAQKDSFLAEYEQKQREL